MAPGEVSRSPDLGRARRRTDAGMVLQLLEELCRTLQPGDTFPSHRELMPRLDASERAVRWALDVLQREGKIVRYHGKGTFVADRPAGGKDAASDTAGASLLDSHTVMAIMTQHDHSFYDRCVELLFLQVKVLGLSLMIRVVKDHMDMPPESLDAIRPAGIVFISWKLAPLARQLQERGHPAVIIGEPPLEERLDVPCVYSNAEQGSYLMTRHLLELGHRCIAFQIGADAGHNRRWNGHQRAIAEARHGREVETIVLSEEEYHSWPGTPDRARAYFRRPAAPTAIVMWNDYEAVKLLTLLSRVGLRVPEDISIGGYDNLPQGGVVHPSLTTVDVAIAQQIEAALKVLALSAPPSLPHSTVVMPTLVRRESTSPAAGLLAGSA